MSIASIQSKYPSAIWFDSNHGGTNSGTLDNPYTSISTAIGAIASNANVIAVLDGSHTISQSDVGGAGDNSTISLGGSADTLAFVGESTQAILNTSGSSKGGMINLRNTTYALKLETIKISHDSNATSQTGLLMVGSKGITVEDCILEQSSNTAGASTHRGMFACEGNSAASSDNLLTVTGSVLQVAASGSFGMMVGGFYVSDWDGATITGNTIVNVGGSSNNLYGTTSLSPSIFKNNIFQGDGASEVLNHTPATNSNNCFGNTGISSGGTNNVFTDPQFVDSTTGDYRLRPSSPCINAGTAS